MAKSVKQLQDEVLGFLETRGVEKSSVEEFVSFGIQKLIEDAGVNFILKVQENLNRLGKIDTGALSNDITITPVETTGDSYSITIGYPVDSKAAKYYDYVNKGVKGFIDESKAPNSPYRYQSEYPKFGGDMHKALMGWYRRNASAGRREDAPRKSISAVQRKRKKLSKMVDADKRLRSLAYATAINIKRKGLKSTGYFDKAIQFSFGKEFTQAVAKVMGREIQINISRDGNNNR